MVGVDEGGGDRGHGAQIRTRTVRLLRPPVGYRGRVSGSGRTLSESASKALLREYGVPLAGEREVTSAEAAAAAADELGYPVVAKLCGDAIAHKTERGLVRLRLVDRAAVQGAAADLLAAATPQDGPVTVLVAPMISGNRELIVPSREA